MSISDAHGETRPCPTDGCDGYAYLAVAEANEWCCDECRTAYVRSSDGEWLGGVDV